MMAVSPIDPLRDPRWPALLQRHRRASVFHTASWLQALQSTYGYEPCALTTAGPGRDLADAIVFCRVKSPLTGCRAVSLPFSDHCDPLVETEEEFAPLLSAFKGQLGSGDAERLELRPLEAAPPRCDGFEPARTFCLHRLELRPDLDELYRNFHKSCVQRKLRTAARAGVQYEEGVSEGLLNAFYGLLIPTRRRHGLPPQPLAWFRSLAAYMGEGLKIRVASRDGRPAAAIVTLRFKDTMTYKYGASDRTLSGSGAMQLLFWEAIREAKAAGLERFDMGRSDWSNPGLIEFKDRWGAVRSNLTYWRYSRGAAQPVRGRVALRAARRICARLPDRILTYAGRLLYRHVG
jgi:CelD/BcsL family acetyltransferase involved in cellulose biosynthesis